MAHLVVRSGGEVGLTCEIAGTAVVGRDGACALVLDDPLVSRRHLRVRLEGSAYVAEDLGTTNGTRLNGAPLTRSEVRTGDELRVGHCVLVFEDADAGTATGSTIIAARGDSTIQASISAESRLGAAAGATVEELREGFELFRQVGEAMGTCLAVDELLHCMLRELFGVFEQADRGFVILAESPSGPFHVSAQRFRHGFPGEVTLSRTVIEHVVGRREAVLSRDAAADDRFAGAGSIITHGIRSVICAPLVCRGEVLGAIHVDTTDSHRPFSEADLASLVALAPQAALSIRHAQLVQEHVESQRLAAIGQTVAGLAHCVKNILNGIQGGSYILDRALAASDAGRIERGWTMVKRNSAFMSDLVLDMLSYAREREPVYESVDPCELLQSVRDLAGFRAGDGAATITCDVDPAVQTVCLDATAMKRCLLNLAVNALEATRGEGHDEAGAVTLACRPGPDPQTVRFTVSDNGCGIPEEHLAQLFTMFFSTKGSKGTGLGLAVCHKIVEEHGGTINVTSTPGEGTEFIIDLPSRSEDGPATETIEPPPA